jgi:N-acylglucosamine 2-epimerase
MKDWQRLSEEFAPMIRRAAIDSLLPFWNRALDRERGGVFTCWNNAGTRLVSRDKYTWSQGRFVWLWSRLAEATARGILPGNVAEYLAQAERTVRFLEAHVFLKNGDCTFLLSESGTRKEPMPGRGLATSIYADCFVAMGLAEFARVAGKPDRLARAWQLLDRIERRVAAGGFPSDPDPIPEGYQAHAVAMIILNVALVISEACDALGDPKASAARRRCVVGTQRLLGTFLLNNGRLAEMLPLNGMLRDNLLCRHFNPGHALESLSLLMVVARREGRDDWLKKAKEAVGFAFAAGWDEPYGGLLHYADYRGGPPVGQSTPSPYEQSVLGNWDKKLWWVHSEAIFATLLAYRLTGDEALRGLFQRVFDYAFRTFPHPDAAVGEWIQIRDRRGMPVDEVVALPVKDPYHILRDLVFALELFSEKRPENETGSR